MTPCFDKKLDHIWGGWSKIEVTQVPGFYTNATHTYIYIYATPPKCLPFYIIKFYFDYQFSFD